ncbi:Increased rDNA silencing protein [Didymosphaeria variabile]|uniref:Increased rDNA silencing protein n=1 Tax=Didymosphaeria variabile TaxID=1932322 RepID=A0A9W8XI13_9PLEO|nr:Increased rDNA silencing protein [Didymosphaeria variabile]KAJ4351292.1 Increased rDNA silencing protein [Didymosphaeria variabile]
MSSASARNTPLVPQGTGDTQYNVRDAALRGASSAFSKPPVKPKPLVNTYTGGGNGALLAATKVGTGGTPRNTTPSGTTTPLRRDWTGGSTRSTARPYASPRQPLSKSSSSSTLAVPEETPFELVPSPSNIAAKLAAARYSPMKPIPQRPLTPIMTDREANGRDALPPLGGVGNVLARLDSRQQNVPKVRRDEATIDPIAIARAKHAGLDRPTDDSPIPPTSSLVNMFEKNRQVSQRSSTPVKSPKPQRAFRLPPEPKDGEPLERQRTKTPPAVKPKPKPLSDLPHSTDGVVENTNFKNMRKDTFGSLPLMQQNPETVADKSTKVVRPRPPPKTLSPHAHSRFEDMAGPVSNHSRRLSSSLSHHESPSSPSSFVSARETQEEKFKPKPTLPPPRRSARPPQEIKRPSTATPLSIPSPTRARASSKPTAPIPPPTQTTPPRRASVSGASTPTGTFYHSNYQRESARSITKHMTGESLSSAIMGAALASSRNASPAPRPSSMHLSGSPSLTATPPLPVRKHHHFSHSPFGRSPSPPKPKPPPSRKLRTTMREDPSSSSDEEESERYKRKGTRIMGMGRKHPNKHHEGTRKRWRDQITERERKRYEGVWAANKGLFITTSPSPAGSRASSRAPHASSEEDPSLDVLNLVVKDIWSRSRLPEHVLEEVWDLVDSRAIGRLKREEFVVGMWLIDQRLKGRKLPIKVSDSVWQSVRGTGVKVKVGDRHSHKVHKPHVKNPLDVKEIVR